MKGWESRIRVTVSPSLWLRRIQERRNMVMGFSHPAQSWVIGTVGKIEIWLNRSLVWMELLLLSMTQRDVANVAAVATSRASLAGKYLKTTALLFIEDLRRGDAFIIYRPKDMNASHGDLPLVMS